MCAYRGTPCHRRQHISTTPPFALALGSRGSVSHLLSSASLGSSQADTEDGVGTELGLVGGPIEVVEELVNVGLVLDVEALLDQSGADDRVDVLDGLGDALAEPLGLVAVAELARLVLACLFAKPLVGGSKHPAWERGRARTRGGARGDNGAVEAALGDDVDLDGGVAARVVHGASVDLGDGHLG